MYCILCKSKDSLPLFCQRNIPASANVPLREEDFKDEILVDLDIVQCDKCLHIYNRAFNPTVIDKIYKRNYSSGIAISDSIISKYNSIIGNAITQEVVADKKIVEIGSSDFTFAKLLLNHGAKIIVAFEPSTLFKINNKKIILINNYFSAKKALKTIGTVDLIVIRHVFEHMVDPLSTLKEISSCLKENALLYIEVPNTQDTIDQARFHDFCYEHVNYFTPQQLTFLVETVGFKVKKQSPLANGQHIGILCRKTNVIPKNNILNKLTHFTGNKFEHKMLISKTNKTLNELQTILKTYNRVAIYGAGTHAIYTLAYLSPGENVRCFFDVNEFKHNMYAPKTHIIIKNPSVELMKDLDAIIIIASLHQPEIHTNLRSIYKYSGIIYGTYPEITKLA